jgi:glycosyltransferase involved in cell wall biosynthesis
MIAETLRDSRQDAATTPPRRGPQPLVTIVIPVYNRLQYLEQAIRSALGQTHAAVEVIVVDDGSPLDPAAVTSRFGDRVALIRKPNGGVASARNTGVARAAGEFVLFLDDDDELEPAAVERLLRAIAEHPGSAWAAGRFHYIDADGRRTPGRESLHFESGDIYGRMIHECLISCPSTVLVRTEVVRTLGLFNASMRLSEDYDLWLRIARDHPIAATPAAVANYRLHAQQISRTQWTRHFEHHLQILTRQRAQARPGFDGHFRAARAELHVQYGDGLYVSGANAEARAQWRLAIAAGGPPMRQRLVGRFVKSRLPRPVLDSLRRLAATTRAVERRRGSRAHARRESSRRGRGPLG